MDATMDYFETKSATHDFDATTVNFSPRIYYYKDYSDWENMISFRSIFTVTCTISNNWFVNQQLLLY